MFYLKQEHEDGDYQDKDGKRFYLLSGCQIWQPDKEVNEGCDEFENDEEAITAYGLTKVEPPEEH